MAEMGTSESIRIVLPHLGCRTPNPLGGGVGICFIILFLALVDKALLVRAGRG